MVPHIHDLALFHKVLLNRKLSSCPCFVVVVAFLFVWLVVVFLFYQCGKKEILRTAHQHCCHDMCELPWLTDLIHSD